VLAQGSVADVLVATQESAMYAAFVALTQMDVDIEAGAAS